MTTNDKLASLRKEMLINNTDAVIIPSSDPHLSEYIAEHWKDREWISGFKGSSGVVIVTKDHAGLWTDSRYFLQAETELQGSNFTLHKLVNQFAPEHIEWLKENINVGGKISVDGQDFSKAQIDNIVNILKSKELIIDTSLDLVSAIWHDRPSLPNGKIFELSTDYTGKTRETKIEEIRLAMKKHEADTFVVTALDDIAWLMNLRCLGDIDFSPVFISYCVISTDKVTLFVDETKFDKELKEKLQNEDINIMSYQDILKFLNEIDPEKTVLVEQSIINAKLYKAINGRIINKDSPIRIAKGLKCQIEIDNYKKTMIVDGVALVKTYKWLEEHVGKQPISEYEFGEKIAHFRSEHSDYRGESFNPIVGYKENGAIVHYHAAENNSKQIKADGILLVDCGGQYLGGTTDITRTFALSDPTEAAKKHNTLVLKGHIAMSQVIFPKGTTGSSIDVLARQFLWDNGLNYLHGTGHGIGFFLNVHEGPHGFAAPSTERGRTPLESGMVITNEPGFYLEGHYGIRIENVMVVKESKMNNFLEFETITLYPYDLKLVDEKALTPKEKAWINKYHNHVFDSISPYLDEAHKEWFRFRCKILG
jgi:Xaa-Pro aminopeptidase